MRNIRFFQWGKTYLIDSEQGAMIKRIFPTDNDEYIECRSDNPLYKNKVIVPRQKQINCYTNSQNSQNSHALIKNKFKRKERVERYEKRE